MSNFLSVFSTYILLFFLLFVNSACAQSESMSYNYEGRGDQKFVDFLETLPDNAQLTLALNHGKLSYYDAAIKLINKKRISLLIDDYCIGGCANYLVPGANEISVSEDAFVAFSETYTAVAHSYSLNIDLLGKETFLEIAANSDIELEIAESYKDDWRKLILPLARMRPTCLIFTPNYDRADWRSMEAAYWAVSGDGLSYFNPDIETIFSADRIISKYNDLIDRAIIGHHQKLLLDDKIYWDPNLFSRLPYLRACL